MDNVTLRIEQGLLSMDGADFQNLCKDVIWRMNQDYSVQFYGSKIGAKKPTIGHPDITLEKDRKYIFSECTTQKNLGRKAIEDVAACLDEEKTKVSVKRIEKIVFFHTNKGLNDSIISEIRDMLSPHGIEFKSYGIFDIALLIENKYPTLARKYFGIALSERCVFGIEEFINDSDNGISPSLKKKFVFRDQELDSIAKAFDTNKFVLLSGNPGVGKTMLGLEFAKRRQSEIEKWSVIKPNPKPCLEEIFEGIQGCDCCLIDDIGSLKESLPEVLNLLKDKKVIATSRAYETNDVIDVLEQVGIKPSLLEIVALSSENISEIIKENTKITNYEYLDKISSISKGNPRIAFMTAEEAIKGDKGFAALFDTSDVFARYFKRRVQQLVDKNIDADALFKVLGLLCLLGRMSVKSINDGSIELRILAMSKTEFMQAVKYLEKNEIVYAFKNDFVGITDQCLADYLSYYVFMEKKSLLLSDVIETFHKNHSDEIVKVINRILDIFRNDQVKEYIEREVRGAWRTFQRKGDVGQLKSFCARYAWLNGDDSLAYVRQHISEKEPFLLGATISGMDWRLCVISSLLRKKDDILVCCELLEAIIISGSIDTNEISNMLCRGCRINLDDYRAEYITQRGVLNFFLDSTKVNSLNFLEAWCVSLLRYSFMIAKDRGKKIEMTTMFMRGGDIFLIVLRNLCFDVLARCDGFYDALARHFSEFPEPDSKDLLVSDMEKVADILAKKKDCDAIQELIVYLKARQSLKYYKLKWDFLENSLKAPLFFILPVVEAHEKEDGYGTEPDENIRRSRLKLIVEATPLEANIQRLELFDRIFSETGLGSVVYDFIKCLFTSFKNQEVYRNITRFLNCKNLMYKLCGYLPEIVSELIKEVGVAETYRIIVENEDLEFKGRAICRFFGAAIGEDAQKTIPLFEQYTENIDVALPLEFDSSFILQEGMPVKLIYRFLKRYYAISKTPMKDDYESVFYRMKPISVESFDYLLTNDVSLLECLYLRVMESKQSYADEGGLCLARIVEKDEAFSVKLAEEFIKGHFSDKTSRMKALWRMPNNLSIGDKMADSLLLKLDESNSGRYTSLFGFYPAQGKKELNSEQLAWLNQYVEKIREDDDVLKRLNLMAVYLGDETKLCYAEFLLNHHVSLDVFSHFVKSHKAVWDASVKALKAEIDFYKRMKDIIPHDYTHLEHHRLTQERIDKLTSEIEPTEKCAWLEDY